MVKSRGFMAESKLLLGGKGIRNLRSAQLPSNVRIHDFLLLNKYGDKYVIVTFEADTEEDANQFAEFFQDLKQQVKRVIYYHVATRYGNSNKNKHNT